MGERDGSRPNKRRRLDPFHAPDGFKTATAEPKPPSSAPLFKSDFHSQSSSSRQLPRMTRVSALTSAVVPLFSRSDRSNTPAKPISALVSSIVNLSHSLDEASKSNLIKSPPVPEPLVYTNITPRKPVSEIMFPPLHQQDDCRAMKPLSTTRLATSVNLNTEGGRSELSSLLMHGHHTITDCNSTSVPLSDNQILRGLDISPEKSSRSASGSRKNSRKYIRQVYLSPQFTHIRSVLSIYFRFTLSGGLADQSSTLLSRSRTAETLWSKQIQASSKNITPDLCFHVVDISYPSSLRAVLVKGIELTEKHEVFILLSRNVGLDSDIQVRPNQLIKVWRPWITVRGVLFCRRFVVVS